MAESDGQIRVNVDLDDKQAQTELNRLVKKIDSLNDKIYQEKQARMPLVEQAKQLGAQLDAAKAKLDSMQNGAPGSVSTDAIRVQQETVKSLQAQWDSAENQVEKYNRSIERSERSLEGATEKAGELSQHLSISSTKANAMAAAGKKAGIVFGRFARRLSGIVVSALFFNAISAGLTSLRKRMWEMIKQNDEAVAAIAKLKGALLTLEQPLLEVIIPALTKVFEMLAEITASAAAVVSSLFGKTTADSAEAAQNMEEEADAIEQVGESAEEAKKSLADFDEINQLSTENAKESSDLNQEKDDEIAPDFSSVIGKKLGELEALVGGALLVLGVILTFSGVNIPLGIALIAAGALTLVAVANMNPGKLKEMLDGWLGNVLFVFGIVAVVIGAILTFSGVNILLGIALMAMGALSIVTMVRVSPEKIKEMLNGWLGNVLVVAGIVAFAIGAILTFSGINIPLGIALMVLGAAALYSVATMAPGKIKEMLNGWLGNVLVVAGIAALAIGAILTFSGINVLLGIALMAMGAFALYSVDKEAPGKIKEMLNGWLGTVLVVAGIAAIAIGAVLAFSGINILLGISLIVLGAAALYSTENADPGKIKEMLNGWLGTALVVVGMIALVIGTVLAFSGFKVLLGVALIAVGAAALFAEATVAPDKLKELLDGWIGTALVIVGMVAIVIGVILAFSGFKIWLGIALIALGAAALFAEATANPGKLQEMLTGPIGDAIEIISGALLVIGMILIVSGANIPLGLGLLVVGVVGIATAQGPTDDWVETLGLDKVSSYVSTAMTLAGIALIAIGAMTANPLYVIGGLLLLGGGAAMKIGQMKKSNFGSSSGGFGSTSGGFGGRSFSLPQPASSYEIPALARGAVIPPNREFLAVLGDQRSGTNVEAPVSEIEAAVARGVAAANAGGNGGPLEIRLILSTKPGIAREMKVELDKESRRRGVKLVQGV